MDLNARLMITNSQNCLKNAANRAMMQCQAQALRAGFEHATCRLEGGCSIQAELPEQHGKCIAAITRTGNRFVSAVGRACVPTRPAAS